jgi:hypothetical protein
MMEVWKAARSKQVQEEGMGEGGEGGAAARLVMRKGGARVAVRVRGPSSRAVGGMNSTASTSCTEGWCGAHTSRLVLSNAQRAHHRLISLTERGGE